MTATHTGAPFAPFGWPALPASGKRVSLPAQFLRLRTKSMTIHGMAADALPEGQEALGFPTGLYLQLGGELQARERSDGASFSIE